MTLDEDLTDDWAGKKKRKPRCRTHYSIDGKTRYCTGRPKGKDNLADSWFYVDCMNCRMKDKNDAAVKRLIAEMGGKSRFQKKKGDGEH